MTTKILVADDSATMRRVLEMTFAGEDAQVHTADSGQAAVSAAREVSPDVVFVDATMDGLDGYELSKQLRADPDLAGAAVILMASQHAPYDESRGRAAGVDDHISKPFDTQSVIDRVSQVLSRPRAQAEAPAAPMAVEPPPPPAAEPRQPPPPPAPAPVGLGAPKPRHSVGGVPGNARTASNRTVMGVGALSSPAPADPPAAPARQPSSPPAAAAPAVAAATGPGSNLAQKLDGLGLTSEQVQGVLALSREVVEQVVWEVVPELAEVLIKEEIKRLTSER